MSRTHERLSQPEVTNAKAGMHAGGDGLALLISAMAGGCSIPILVHAARDAVTKCAVWTVARITVS